MKPYEPRFESSLLWPDPEKGPLCLDLKWAEVRGRWECIGLTVRTYATAREDDPLRAVEGTPRGLEAQDLRGIPLYWILAKESEQWRQAWSDLATTARTTGFGEADLYDSMAETVGSGPRRGRPPRYGAEHWAKVAAVYREAYRDRRRPTQAVAQQFNVARSTAAKWVATCRRRGLLGPTEKRKAGGVLPPEEKEDSS